MLTEMKNADLNELLANKKVAIVGVGNRLRGDDGVGSVIAEQLQLLGVRDEERGTENVAPNATVIDAETVPENYLGLLLDLKPDVVLFVDAVDFGGRAGEWVLLPLSVLGDKVPSTHTVSLKLLGQILETNGVESWLLAIQPGQIGFGAPMSEAVISTARQIVQVLSELVVRGTEEVSPDSKSGSDERKPC